MSACADYFAAPHLTCGLVTDHVGPHVSVPPDQRRRFRWVKLPDGRRVPPPRVTSPDGGPADA